MTPNEEPSALDRLVNAAAMMDRVTLQGLEISALVSGCECPVCEHLRLAATESTVQADAAWGRRQDVLAKMRVEPRQKGSDGQPHGQTPGTPAPAGPATTSGGDPAAGGTP